MRHEHLSGPRLRFPVKVGERESIPGVIVRGVRQHVLIRTAPVLEAACVGLRHVGLSQIATPEQLARIAYVARCPANDLMNRAGVRVVTRDDDRSYDAQFGRLLIPRAYVEFDRRRIGPVTLASETYHRASWMNLLLPYCPESLERLVDRCGHCDKALGWFYARGVGHCDHCGLEIEPSAEASLADEMAEDYRLFAQLSSPDSRGIETVCAQLPASLATVSPGSLVRIALLLGGLVQPGSVVTTSRHLVPKLSASTLAAVTTSGIALLRTWPDGIRSWVAAKTEELRGSPSELVRLRARLKRLADRNQEADDVVSAVTDALPGLRRHAAHGFAAGRPYYLYKQVQTMLGLSSQAMDRLKKLPDISFLKLNTAAKEQGQFDAEQIDELRPVFRDSVFLSSCADAFGLPLYAIEQLCAAPDLLEWENHPALLAAGMAVKVRGTSIERLSSTLFGAARHDKMPEDCVSLAVAAKRIGGRLKPWATIVNVFKTGGMAFWVPGTQTRIPSFRVRVHELARFQSVVDAEAPAAMPVSMMVSQRDAAEILNIKSDQVIALAEVMNFRFDRCGSRLVAPRDAVLAAAAEVAFSAEIALHQGIHHRQVEAALSSMGFRRHEAGWDRNALVKRSIIPASPGFATETC